MLFENVFSYIFVINEESHQIKSNPEINSINATNSNKDLDYLQQCINLLIIYLSNKEA